MNRTSNAIRSTTLLTHLQPSSGSFLDDTGNISDFSKYMQAVMLHTQGKRVLPQAMSTSHTETRRVLLMNLGL